MARMYQLDDEHNKIYAKVTSTRRIRCCVCNNKFVAYKTEDNINSQIIYYIGTCPLCGRTVGEAWYKEGEVDE